MFGLFKKAADPMQTVQSDTVSLDYHRMVVEAHKDEVDNLRAESFDATRRAESAMANAQRLGKLASETLAERDAARAETAAARERLRRIAAMETPGCAPAARRMARVAREGLPEFAVADAA